MKEPLDKNKLGKGRKGPWDNETIKLIDEKSGELLLECKIGDKYHQAILEVGLNTILEELVNGNDWESKIDKEWTPLNEEV
jgi:hypothetical protein|tara:strand:+ start:162 stop:404 length:243 start_codon:yes stop_codon:yes gene_type:complete